MERGIQSQLANNQPFAGTDPLEQDLILKLVLEHVGTADLTDLLNCRLVNQSWNRLAVEVLEQLGCTVVLNYERLPEFRDLLWNIELSRMMNFEPYFLKPASLRLSLNLDSYYHRRYRAINSIPRGEMTETLQLIMSFPHLRVAIINYKHDNSELDQNREIFLPNQARELLAFFKLASKDLTDVTMHFGGILCHNFKEFDLDNLHWSFPKLTSINYRVDTNVGTDSLELIKPLLTFMVRAANLKTLRIHVCKHRTVFPDQEEQTTHPLNNFIQSYEVFQACSTTLEELHLRLECDGGHKVLNGLTIPKLRILGLHCDLSPPTSKFHTTREFKRFLLGNPTLEILELSLIYPLWPKYFPIFSNIHHLRLPSRFFVFPSPTSETSDCMHTIFVQVTNRFPSLRFMNFHLGQLFMFGSHFEACGQPVPPADKYPTLPSVSTLEIQITAENTYIFDLLEKQTQMYHHTFPNVETLVIKLEDMIFEITENNVKRAIQFLSSHPSVRRIVIQSYKDPQLREIPDGVRLNLEAKKRRLIIPKIPIEREREVGDVDEYVPPPPVDLSQVSQLLTPLFILESIECIKALRFSPLQGLHGEVTRRTFIKRVHHGVLPREENAMKLFQPSSAVNS